MRSEIPTVYPTIPPKGGHATLKINLRTEEIHLWYLHVDKTYECICNIIVILMLLDIYIHIRRRNDNCDATRSSVYFGGRIILSLMRGQFTFALELLLESKRSFTSLELKTLYFGIEKRLILEQALELVFFSIPVRIVKEYRHPTNYDYY